MNIFRKLLFGLIKKNRYLNQEFYAKIYYEYYHEKKLNLENPVAFNEKIQWLKVYFHIPILNVLVDKYEVLSYVKDKIGADYIKELYEVYNEPSEIDFDALPNQFVLKGTHGCHMNIIVSDKAKLNIIKSKYRLNKWARRNLYYSGGQEWAYKDVKPRFIAERYYEEMGGNLNDYRFYCFSGVPKFIQVDTWVGTKRFICNYDLNWNRLPFSSEAAPPLNGEIEKPSKLKLMTELAIKLADDFPFIRVDFFVIKNKIFFGELTFYPTDSRCDFIPFEYNKTIGDYLTLPKIPEDKNEITSW